jgi:hypothetical protein
MAGPSKYMHLLVNLAYAQDDVEEKYADIDSGEELEDAILHQFVGEQSGLNKTAARKITEYSQPFWQ